MQREPREAYVYLAGADGRPVRGTLPQYERWVRDHPDCPLLVVAHALFLDPDFDALLKRFPDHLEVLSWHLERAIAEDDTARVGRLLDQSPPTAREDDRFWRFAAWHYGRLSKLPEAEAACRRALDAEAVDIGLITRMLERATEHTVPEQPPTAATVIPARFARDPGEFAVNREVAG